jgi:hypothetical protein
MLALHDIHAREPDLSARGIDVKLLFKFSNARTVTIELISFDTNRNDFSVASHFISKW